MRTIRPAPCGTSISPGDLLEFLAVCCVCDLAADATTACGVGHQDAVPTSQRQISGQRSTLVATFFFHDLHQQYLANFDDFLNLVATWAWLAHGADVFAVIFIGNGFNGFVLGRCSRLWVLPRHRRHHRHPRCQLPTFLRCCLWRLDPPQAFQIQLRLLPMLQLAWPQPVRPRLPFQPQVLRLHPLGMFPRCRLRRRHPQPALRRPFQSARFLDSFHGR